MGGWRTIRQKAPTSTGWGMVMIAVGLGLCFRLIHLGQGIYWVDEVATSIRISGYTRQEVVQQLSTGTPLFIPDLQRYQQLSPDRTWSDTLHALTQSPEHTPLYFLLARAWTQRFGSSVMAIRSLSVVVSIAALPCLYGLCLELFQSPQIGRMATVFFSLSPLLVAYAQEARPYSLWMMLLLASSALLWRALRTDRPGTWVSYAMVLTLSLYTSLLTVLVAIAQTLFLLIRNGYKLTPQLRHYGLSLGGVLVAFLPWGWVMVRHWPTLQANTTWMREPLEWLAMPAIWLYSLTVLFFDVPVSIDPSLATAAKILTSTAVLGLMIYGLYALVREAPRSVGLFVVAIALSTPLTLGLVDLLIGGQLSTAARYLLPFHLGALVAIAHLITRRITDWAIPLRQRRIWQGVAIALVGISILSCLLHWIMPPKYQKSRNLSNPAIARLVNEAASPLLVAEASQTTDVISLSYLLDPDVTVEIFSAPSLASFSKACQPTFLFNPSDIWRADLQQNPSLFLEEIYQPKRLIPSELALSLWKIKTNVSCPP